MADALLGKVQALGFDAQEDETGRKSGAMQATSAHF